MNPSYQSSLFCQILISQLKFKQMIEQINKQVHFRESEMVPYFPLPYQMTLTFEWIALTNQVTNK